MAVTKKRCLSCLYGTIVNGVCNRCHRREREPSSVALPRETILHKRYYIGDALGQGGFGITYAAWDRGENLRVAVKELYPARDVTRSADRHTVQVYKGQECYFARVRECFEKEAQTLMRLQGLDGVISLYHLFSDNGTLYYVMEYLDGMDLNAYLAQNGRMRWEKLAQIVETLLGALKKLHREGLIHRDISPDNIFLPRGGLPRLIDFGSVRVYQGAAHFTAFVKGHFAPWEQYQTEGEQGPWTDIYALCVTLYYALSGKLPPMASDRRLRDTVVPLGKLCPELPPHVAEAIMYGMAVRVQDRCRSAEELAGLLFPGKRGSLPCLVCRAGYHKGKQWVLRPGSCCRIGRQPGREVLYPAGMKEVSRTQCTVFMDVQGRVLVRDESSCGTCLETGHGRVRLQPDCWYLASGCSIFFGQQEEYCIE